MKQSNKGQGNPDPQNTQLIKNDTTKKKKLNQTKQKPFAQKRRKKTAA